MLARLMIFCFVLPVVSGLVPPASAAGEKTLQTLTIISDGRSHVFTVEVADTAAARARGLMGREHLPDGHGMLFDFRAPQRVAMWMKDTPLSLDMIFIAGDGRVLGAAERTIPFSLKPIEAPGRPRYVLEVIAGTAERVGIRAGDRVVLSTSKLK